MTTEQSATERLAEIRKYHTALPSRVGFEDVAWLLAEVDRLRNDFAVIRRTADHEHAERQKIEADAAHLQDVVDRENARAIAAEAELAALREVVSDFADTNPGMAWRAHLRALLASDAPSAEPVCDGPSFGDYWPTEPDAEPVRIEDVLAERLEQALRWEFWHPNNGGQWPRIADALTTRIAAAIREAGAR